MKVSGCHNFIGLLSRPIVSIQSVWWPISLHPTLPYLYHIQLHGCPPILLKKESISVFYVFFENRCFEMVKSSIFWDIWLFWKWNGFFPLFLAFLFMSQSHFSFLRVTKIMESLNLSYEIIEKQWLKNYQCKSLRSQKMDDLSI